MKGLRVRVGEKGIREPGGAVVGARESEVGYGGNGLEHERDTQVVLVLEE